MARPRTSGSLFNPVNSYARPSAYDPNRQAPTGKNANPDGTPLSRYQMEMWNRSRREAANDYAYQNRGQGIQNPVTPATPRGPREPDTTPYELDPGAYQFAGSKHDRSQQEFNGDNETSYYNNPVRPAQTPRAQAAPMNPINTDHAVGRPRTAAPSPVFDEWTYQPGQQSGPATMPVQYDRSQLGYDGGSDPPPRYVTPPSPVAPFREQETQGLIDGFRNLLNPAARMQGAMQQGAQSLNQNPGGVSQQPPRPSANMSQQQPFNWANNPVQGTDSLSPYPLPGFAGMTAQGILAGQGRGPAVAKEYEAGQWDARRREQKITEDFAEDIANSSTDAARKAQAIQNGISDPTGGSVNFENPLSAHVANGYNGYVADVNDPNRMSSEEKFSIAQRAAQSGQISNPVSGRFPDARAIGVMESAVDNGSMYRIPQGYGTQPEYHQVNPSPEVLYRKKIGGGGSSYLPPSSDPVLARQNAMMKQPGPRYIPLTLERRAEKAAEKAAETSRRADVKFKHMVGQGMNPLSPKARGMFPEQVARMKGGTVAGNQNPVGVFKPGGVVTAGGQAAADNFMRAAATGGTAPDGSRLTPNPFIAGTGATGEEDNVETLHFGMQSQIQAGVTPSTDDLRALHGYLVAFDTKHRKPGYDPFDMSSFFDVVGAGVGTAHTQTFGPMYKDLVGMKAPSDKQLGDWWSGFSSKVRPDSPFWSWDRMNQTSTGGTEFPR